MPTLHDLLAASIDERALRYAIDDSGARPETLRHIRRVRRRNSIATGTTSAIAVTSGFFVAAHGDNSVVSPAGDPADATGEVVIDLTDLAPFPSLPGPAPDAVCGVPIADIGGAPEVDGFAITTGWHQDGAIDPEVLSMQIRSAVTYDGEPRPPAFVDTGYAVIVADGAVVALVEPSSSPHFARLDSGSEWVDYVTLRGGADNTILACDGGDLAAGDYEVYVIAQAGITNETLARQLLAEQGVVLASESDEEWAPGSQACDREARYPTTGRRVLQCQPELAPNVTFDRAAGTATVTYAPELYAGALSVQLVSEPLTLRIAGDVELGIRDTEPGTRDIEFGTGDTDVSIREIEPNGGGDDLAPDAPVVIVCDAPDGRTFVDVPGDMVRIESSDACGGAHVTIITDGSEDGAHGFTLPVP